jgi:Ras family
MPVPSEPPPLPWNYISKLVCIGDSGCGKSSLTIRLCEGRFVNSHDVTIGVEFGSRIVPVGPPQNGGTFGNISPGIGRKGKDDGKQKHMKVNYSSMYDAQDPISHSLIS